MPGNDTASRAYEPENPVLRAEIEAAWRESENERGLPLGRGNERLALRAAEDPTDLPPGTTECVADRLTHQLMKLRLFPQNGLLSLSDAR